jgi:hypothetical protein
MLKTNYTSGQYWVQVSLDDMIKLNEELVSKLQDYPCDYMPLVSAHKILFASITGNQSPF